MPRLDPVVAWALLAAGIVSPSSALADGSGETMRIAVLPWVAADSEFATYGLPIAAEVRRRLAKGAGREIVAVKDGRRVPAVLDFVIDGRIVSAAKKDELRLQARLRDPVVGRLLASVETRAGSVENLDALAAEMAAALEKKLAVATRDKRLRAAERTAAARAAEERREKVKEPTVVKNDNSRRRLRLLVPKASSGTVGRPGYELSTPATQATAEIVSWLGAEAIWEPARAFDLTHRQVADRLRESGADYALLTELLRVDFSWNGVLLAQGRVRFKLVNRQGASVYDSIASTDTVVGSRGDGYSALAYFATSQAAMMVAPQLRKVIAK